MNLKPLSLYKHEEQGKDELNNPIKVLVEIKNGSSVGRFSSWSEQDLEIEGRDVTKEQRKIVTLATREECEEANHVCFESLFYQIKEVRGDETTRWRLMFVDRHGNELNELQ